MSARRTRLLPLACLLVAILTACAAPPADQPTNQGQPPSPSTASPARPSEGVVRPTPIAVIGDSFTTGSPADSGPSALWPALLSADDFAVTAYAWSGTGYAATWDTPEGPSNFVTRVERMPDEGIDHLVFFGSINDGWHGYDATRAGAEEAFSDAQAKWPDAMILVIGPASPIWPVPESYLEARDATQDAAQAAGLTFIDPIEAGWFDGMPDLIGFDGVHPNDQGHAYLADQIRGVLEQHLP
ncbi:SGNH/GDSL hydrolase family protein [Microbacterium sp. HD4P20]|uniref:SGNH/GDSL hydrolase family protein n=1 Tax=Microbacterium sp. HD4P20 TaxID=2864874 RepID=UPI001C64289A|nr:SGNH/GDSL hydrolase family protein [Microbacterium sp. HD4P20]MCP2635381.1 SGNH/GDSL hydrolase family protein [Microbacterium sp. HD4P20]